MPGIEYFQRCLDITEGLQHVGYHRGPSACRKGSREVSIGFVIFVIDLHIAKLITQSIFDKCTLLHFSFSSHKKIMTVALQEGKNVDT